MIRADFLKRLIGIGAGLAAAPLLPETSEPPAPLATTGYLQIANADAAVTTTWTSTDATNVVYWPNDTQWSYTR